MKKSVNIAPHSMIAIGLGLAVISVVSLISMKWDVWKDDADGNNLHQIPEDIVWSWNALVSKLSDPSAPLDFAWGVMTVLLMVVGVGAAGVGAVKHFS